MQEAWWNEFGQSDYENFLSRQMPKRPDTTIDELGYELGLRAESPEMHFGPGDSVWGRTQKEFRLLVCERHEKYAKLREDAKRLTDQGVTAFIAALAAGLGSVIGVAAAAISPLIALLLLALSRLGIEVFCSSGYSDVTINKL